MKKLATCIVCLALASLGAVATGGDKGAPKLEGNWVITGGISKGKKLPDEAFAKIKLTAIFEKGKYRINLDGMDIEAGSYKIDASKKPVTIDMDVTEGMDKGKTQLGILKLEGDNLTMAVGKAGSKDRLKNFDGDSPDGEVTYLKRSKK